MADNILFKDGKTMYVPAGAPPEKAASYRMQLQKFAAEHGGFSSIDVDEYADLMAPEDKKSFTMPNLGNIAGLVKGAFPGAAPPVSALAGGLTKEISPLQAGGMIDAGSQFVGEELGQLGAAAATGLATKRPGAIATGAAVGAGAGRVGGTMGGDFIKGKLDIPTQDRTMGEYAKEFGIGMAGEGIGRGVTSGLPQKDKGQEHQCRPNREEGVEEARPDDMARVYYCRDLGHCHHIVDHGQRRPGHGRAGIAGPGCAFGLSNNRLARHQPDFVGRGRAVCQRLRPGSRPGQDRGRLVDCE